MLISFSFECVFAVFLPYIGYISAGFRAFFVLSAACFGSTHSGFGGYLQRVKCFFFFFLLYRSIGKEERGVEG